MKIEKENFPYAVELMREYLFQESADSMTEAVEFYFHNGEECVQEVLKELDSLLSGAFSEAELTQFVLRYSDYILDDSGKETLDFIRRVLRGEPHRDV